MDLIHLILIAAIIIGILAIIYVYIKNRIEPEPEDPRDDIICKIIDDFNTYDDKEVIVKGRVEKTERREHWKLHSIKNESCVVIFHYKGNEITNGNTVELTGQVSGRASVEGITYPFIRRIHLIG